MFYEYKKRCSYTGDIIRSYFEVNQQQDVLDLNDVLAYQNDGEVCFILCRRILKKNLIVGLINACWRCRLCDEEVYFFTREELADHLVETHGRNRETTCLRCNFQLPSRTDLKRHRCFVINGDTVVCFVCNKEFSDMSKLKIHVEIQHEFACFPCMKVLKSRRAYRKHNRMFHKRDLLEYKCSICEKYFTKMASLKLHLRVAHKKKVKVASKCPYCRKPCLRGYRKHVASHEKPGVRKYTCTICKFVYFSPSAFLTHLRGYHELEINGF